jgi:hypothetical protein
MQVKEIAMRVSLLVAAMVYLEANPTCAAEPRSSAHAAVIPAKSAPTVTIEAALRDDFLVLPIRTELQRARGSKYAKAKAVVVINAVKAIKGEDESLDAKALKLSKIWEAAKPLAAGEPGNLIFWVRTGKYVRRSFDDGTWPASSILMEALANIGRRIGFQDAEVELFFLEKTDDWERTVTDHAPRPEEEKIEEPGVGDQHVKLYPVRTRLSRMLYFGADCVVDTAAPTDDVNVPAAIATMKRCLPQLGLKQKKLVFLMVDWKSPAIAHEISKELMGEHVFRDLLGFEVGGCLVKN